ncbi:MAG: hypothetical protein ACRCVA_19735 [Phreatobacter sp.]
MRVAASLYFYGEDALAVAAREQKAWNAWLAEHFEAPPGTVAGS